MLIAALLLIACAAGFLLQRRLRARGGDPARVEAESIKQVDLSLLLRLFVALLVSFVLAQTFSAFRDAGAAAADEAAAVLSEAQLAQLLPAAQRREVTSALACYARSVVDDEWPALADSGQTPARTERASAAVQLALGRAAEVRLDPTVFASLLSGEGKRVESRRTRIQSAEPAIPTILMVLLVGASAIALVNLAALPHPAIGRGVQAAVVGATAVLLAGTILVTDDLQHPYGGMAEVEPDGMRGTERQIIALAGPAGSRLDCPD